VYYEESTLYNSQTREIYIFTKRMGQTQTHYPRESDIEKRDAMLFLILQWASENLPTDSVGTYNIEGVKV
jgi:hypothetical protein